eukprot:CAMPEP_0172541776 /NCGR_PEP_ID=MMETSP1067-20121228/12543_1 /TAXON_ID=265564 ORGANISM="Thalassiosira punctigera, Strain Tpunct2005C2" /NCGR_SAMPLE_ID=MMETSP1067 /ASSEMBLY_ACC=CAM_ASM_000444 /LENGTH=77 /DNA_ID=CAMNT_0013327891 /DNA_START=33 /DNA_END=263 /DNA_ORIENTATION=+
MTMQSRDEMRRRQPAMALIERSFSDADVCSDDAPDREATLNKSLRRQSEPPGMEIEDELCHWYYQKIASRQRPASFP